MPTLHPSQAALVAELFAEMFVRLGYCFRKTPLDLNPILIRADEDDPGGDGLKAGVFNDMQALVGFDEEGHAFVHTSAYTTDPGPKYLRRWVNPKGTAILIPGQHRDMWCLGHHMGKYKAIVQGGPRTGCQTCHVWRQTTRSARIEIPRDITKDDPGVYEGYFGINNHHAGVSLDWFATFLGASAGCQVAASRREYEKVILPLFERSDRGMRRRYLGQYTRGRRPTWDCTVFHEEYIPEELLGLLGFPGHTEIAIS